MTTVATLRATAAALLAGAGMPRDRAEESAAAVVLADVWGVASHGLMRLPYYLARLAAGGCNPAAELRTVADTGPLVSLDGDGGLGHWQLWRAAGIAAERCAVHGVAAVAVADSSHCGALGVYTLPLVRAGLAGLVFSNGPAVMPPWEGAAPVLSTSPVAAGFPVGGRAAIVDLATSAVARGRIAQHARAGLPLPDGWALAADGTPTNDASAALHGMLAPLGGAKGFALAFAVEALTGGLVGPALSTEVVDMFAPSDAARRQSISHLLIALDPAALSPGAAPRLAALAENVATAGGRVPGAGRPDPREVPDDHPLPLDAQLTGELAQWAERLEVRLPPGLAPRG